MLLLLLPFLNGCLEENNSNHNAIYVDDSGGADYTSIQQAIDNASDNGTIVVHPGVYMEHIIINKTITLIGEDASTTIINGSGSGDVIHITSKGRANIQGFTICKSGNTGYPDYNSGIKIESSSSGNIIKNNIISNNLCGIHAISSSSNNFSYNIFAYNEDYGMYLFASSNKATIYHNVFIDNECGLRIKSSRSCIVSMNVFINNEKGMYFCCGSKDNTVFHNTFINNTIWNADDLVGGNNWDNGEEGNYWSDYNGTDDNDDGIGDTPYNLKRNGLDHYPLMQPIVTYEENKKS